MPLYPHNNIMALYKFYIIIIFWPTSTKPQALNIEVKEGK